MLYPPVPYCKHPLKTAMYDGSMTFELMISLAQLAPSQEELTGTGSNRLLCFRFLLRRVIRKDMNIKVWSPFTIYDSYLANMILRSM